jgi:hypothetical protein
MKPQINEIKRMQQLAGILKENEDLNETVFSSNDLTTILKKAKDAIEMGDEVTVDGIKISKVVPAAGAFFPADGSPSLRIKNYLNNIEAIKINGVSAELKPYEQPSITQQPSTSADKAAWQDRYGQGGGVDTAFGRYTGD